MTPNHDTARVGLEHHKQRLIIGITIAAVAVTALFVFLGTQSRKAPAETKTDFSEIETGITADGFPYQGSPNAPVKLIEYSDYLCGHCRNFNLETEPKIVDEYVATGQVQYIYHYYALGEAQVLLGEAAHCAADQGRFWEYHRVMFENQGRFSSIESMEGLQALLAEFAEKTELDIPGFETCWSSHQHQQAIIESILAAREIGVGGTPTFSIQGELLVGNQPYQIFQQTIDSSLTEVEQ